MQQRAFKANFFSLGGFHPADPTQRAVETAAPWKPWKNRKNGFAPVPTALG
jgi:hypothetical protein